MSSSAFDHAVLPLNSEQRRLVEENVGIAYHIAYQLVGSGYVPRTLTEDAVQEAMIGLIQAARAFEPARGLQFSTLAATCCRNRILTAIGREARQTRLDGISLDAVYSEDTKRLADQLAAKDDTEAEAGQWLADAVRRLLAQQGGENHVQILMEYAMGKTMPEIARERGVTRQAVNKHIRKARAMLAKTLRAGED